MKKIIATTLLATTILMGTGCVHKTKPVIPEPPQVQFERGLLAAADAVNLVANGLSAVDNTRKQLLAQGQIDQQDSDAILKVLQQIAIKNEAAVQAINLAQTGGNGVGNNWQNALIAVVKQAQSIDPKVFAVKNPNAQATLRVALATLDSALQAIVSIYGGK